MNTSDTALRYSKALFQSGSSKEELERRLSDLTQIIETFKQFPKVSKFFASPQISIESKKQALNSALSGIDPQLKYFLFLLLDKNRFKLLPDILHFYRSMVIERIDALEVHLITASPIDAEIRNSLKEKLEKMYRKTILIKEEMDPTLIGGGILMIGNQQIDFSIKGKLAKLKRDLLSITV